MTNQGESLPSTGKCMCKVPAQETGLCPICWRNSEEATVAGTESSGGGEGHRGENRKMLGQIVQGLEAAGRT